MAWTYYPGVHSAINQITGPGTPITDTATPVTITADLTPTGNPVIPNHRVFGSSGAPHNAPLNAIRTITWADDTLEFTGGFASQTDRINKLASANGGMFVIPCFSCHQGTDQTKPGWDGTTAVQWHDRLITWFNKIKDSVSVVEIGNEPVNGDWFEDGTGFYFTKLRAAVNILKGIKPSIEVLAAGIPTGASITFLHALHNNETVNSIWSLIDGFSLHPYYKVAGDMTYPVGDSNYGPPYVDPGTHPLPHMIDWVASRRYQLDHGGRMDAGPLVPAAQACHMWITEFGWHTQNQTDVPNTYAQEGHGPDRQALKLENAWNAFKNNAEDLKIRAACAFAAQDYVHQGQSYGADHVYGLRRDRSNAGYNSTAPVDWKDGILTTLGNIALIPVLPPTDPPVVQTLPVLAADLTSSSAKLRGTVNPKGTATNYHFEYQQVANIPLPTQHTLFLSTSSISGGTGSVTGPGVTAPPASQVLMDEGTSKLLTEATTDTFTGWTQDGVDMGTGTTLDVTMSTDDIHVNGEFTGVAGPTLFNVTVNVSGPGSIQVRQQPGGALIGTAVPGTPYQTGQTIPDGTTLTLDYIPNASTFTSWGSIPSGVVTGATEPKDVVVTQNLIITGTAAANVITRVLDVNLSQTGAGTLHVYSCDAAGVQVAGIDTTITGNSQTGLRHLTGIQDGSTHHLKEQPTSCTFNGWTGAGTGAGNIRTILMDGDKVVNGSATGAAVPLIADLYVNSASPAGGNGTTTSITAGDPNRAFATITAGINAIPANKIVGVAAGDYTENISITKSNFTLRGETPTRPRIVKTGINNFPAGINVTGNASNVVIENIEVFDLHYTGSDNPAGLIRLVNAGAINCNNITIRNCKLHKGRGLDSGTPSFGGICVINYAGYANYTPAKAMRNLTIEDNEIYEIGAGSTDGYNEHMGIFMAGVYNATVQRNSIYLCRKEAIRDLEGLRNTFKDNHFFLNWSGGSVNYGNGSKWYNNASYFNQIGFEPKHTNYYLSGGAAGTDHWNGETASAANNRNIFAHNTGFGNIGSDFDVGQGGDLFDYVTIEDNLFASRGTCNLRDFTPIGSHILIDHNNYNTPAGTPPAAPRAYYARNFPGTANQDSSPGFAGFAGTYDTNADEIAVTFTNTANGNFNRTSPVLPSGTDLSDGYGTQTGCEGAGAATKTWTQHTYTATTTLGGGSLALLSDGAYDTAWQATNAAPGSITFDLGISKTTEVMIVDTIIRQNGPGQYKAYTIETSPDNSTWTQRLSGSIPDDLRTSTKHRWTPVGARYIRFNITTMWQGNPDRLELAQVRLGFLT